MLNKLLSVVFLVDILDLASDPIAVNYVSWFDGTGTVLNLIVPFAISLLFVLIFYYLWARFKALTTFNWLMTGLVNVLVGFVATLFMCRASLANFIDSSLIPLDPSFQTAWDNVVYWPFTSEVWMFAVNSILWSLIFFFLLSIVLKRWSIYHNIPFGKKNKKVARTDK